MEGENKVQNMSFDSMGSMQSIESSQSNLISKISAMSLEDDFEDILESFEEPEIFEGFENPESEACSEFPNEVYKDLMLLVMRHKLIIGLEMTLYASLINIQI